MTSWTYRAADGHLLENLLLLESDDGASRRIQVDASMTSLATMASVSIQAIWSDVDVIRIDVSVKTDRFAGSTTVYTTVDALQDAARSLSGFPANPNDSRSFALSTTYADVASFELKCIDSAGHAVMIASIVDRERNAATERDDRFPHFF